MRYFTLIIASILFFFNRGLLISSPSSINNDTTFSSEKIYISILPSDDYLDSIQNVIQENEWNEIVSDNEYYRYLTEQYLESNGYTNVNKPNCRFWKFQLKNKKLQIFDSNTLQNDWGVLIYNSKDSVFFYDGTMPEIELEGKI